jgi:hypothetical protein
MCAGAPDPAKDNLTAALIESLKGENRAVRNDAQHALVAIGKRAIPGLELAQQAKDLDEDQRFWIDASLKKIRERTGQAQVSSPP